ncbi:MAG: hypothetical protein JSW11_00185 [Candidatus Heimdallarchaeota archaeon]|nr:MAG: hypothetical protein JSW11_00185 [Candidatus Heimdallarchaeota archaeon]
MVGEPDREFKWPICDNFMMPAPAEKVWEVISTPEILEQTHPCNNHWCLAK